MPSHQPGRTELCRESTEVRMEAAAIDVAALRAGFSQLFDRAALRVQQAGRDLDEVVIGRFVTCRLPSGRQVEAPIEFLSDARVVQRQVAQAAGVPMPHGLSGVVLTCLSVRVWLDVPR